MVVSVEGANALDTLVVCRFGCAASLQLERFQLGHTKPKSSQGPKFRQRVAEHDNNENDYPIEADNRLSPFCRMDLGIWHFIWVGRFPARPLDPNNRKC